MKKELSPTTQKIYANLEKRGFTITAYLHFLARRKHYKDHHAYEEALCQDKHSKSKYEHLKDVHREKGFESTLDWKNARAMELAKQHGYPTWPGYKYNDYALAQLNARGYHTRGDWRRALWRRHGIESWLENEMAKAQRAGLTLEEYKDEKARARGFENAHTQNQDRYRRQIAREGRKDSRKEKQKQAKNLGYDNYMDLMRSLTQRRQAQFTNRVFKTIFNMRAKQLGLRNKDLAELLDVNRALITQYSQGVHIPSRRNQLKVFRALQLPYTTLDECIRDIVGDMVEDTPPTDVLGGNGRKELTDRV